MASPGVRITPLAERKKGIPSASARGPSMMMAISESSLIPLRTPGSPGRPGARWMWVRPMGASPPARMGAQRRRRVPWARVGGSASGVRSGVSSSAGTCSECPWLARMRRGWGRSAKRPLGSAATTRRTSSSETPAKRRSRSRAPTSAKPSGPMGSPSAAAPWRRT